MEFNQMWYALMYGVGVFVTCNVGGQVLMRLMAGRKTARRGMPVRLVGMSAEEMSDFEKHLTRFMENRRQVDANRTDADADSQQWQREADADADAGFDDDDEFADAESDAPEESGTETDGDSMPYGEGRYQIRTA